MPERRTPGESWRAGKPITLEDVTLLAIEKVSVQSDEGESGNWVRASVEPFAIIVRDRNGTRAYDPDANAVSLETLREKVSDLDSLLASL